MNNENNKCVQYHDRHCSKILTHTMYRSKCHKTIVIVNILICYFKSEATEVQGGDINGPSSARVQSQSPECLCQTTGHTAFSVWLSKKITCIPITFE